MLPLKSKNKYENAYNKFIEWRKIKKVKSLSESVFLAYFSELAEKLAPTSVWAIYSMLRSVISARHNLNIHDYGRLISFLKINSKGHTVKKANV